MKRPPRPRNDPRAACDGCGKPRPRHTVLVAPRHTEGPARWLLLCDDCRTRPGRAWRRQYDALDPKSMQSLATR